jgi:hypothetical protein
MPTVVVDTAAEPLAAGLSAVVLTLAGVSFGAGQTWRLSALTGIDELPNQRTQDLPRAHDDGDYPGEDFSAARVVQATLLCRGPQQADLTAIRHASRPTQFADQALVIAGYPGYPDLRIVGRWRNRAIPADQGLQSGALARAVLQFYAPDPRLYAAVESVLTTGPGASTSGGLAPPLTPPLTPSGSATGGQLQATNVGNTTTRPLLRVNGPVPGFDLLQLTTGRALRYRQAIAAGDFVVIDTDARSVLLNGVASRRSALSGAWWDLPPGTSDIRYLPTGLAEGSSFELRWRSAWL